MNSTWQPAIDLLYAELDEWNFNGDEAFLWWRDDDAQSDSEALQQLLSLSEKHNAPVALAVIPNGADNTLQQTIKQHPQIKVLQHGYSHTNHAPQNEKKQELGNHRSSTTIHQELTQGFNDLTKNYGEQFIPVMTPPWNRVHPDIIPTLASIGYKGLSCYTPRQDPEPAQDVWQINTHVDIINWKQNKSFIGAQSIAAQFAKHLKGKRTGQFDTAEPTGLLTHHLVHDQQSWQFLDHLLAAIDEHPAATWLSAERAFQTKWR